jgi:Ca-activated chloride channel homolog
VEPLAVPDVFAERPALVYGKWRGQPQGKITVTGLAGNEPYSRTIEVSGVKPLEANAALRYLWARSRIAELGDYNLLQRDDQHVTDITNLALRYNLLSAYTSFVAIDSEVRRKGGEVTTIKQPLPLPEGVSDFAVGNMAYAPMMAAPAAGRSEGTVSMKQLARSGQSETKSPSTESRPAISPEEKQPSRDKATQSLKIARINVSGGLSEGETRKALEQYLEAIRNCYRATLTGVSAEITLEWTIDAGGKVRGLRMVGAKKDAKSFEQCLVELAKQWYFTPPTGSGSGRVTVVLGD